jgi:UDP-2-acetamido-3-amino-2,3-dideoxy-glucuronate N-acetyltransferase
MIKIHPTAEIDKKSNIGNGTIIWNQAQIRKGASIGKCCIIGKNAYIDTNVILGNNVKVQNNASIYQGVTLEDGVFIGPHTCFTNDKNPRAINPNGTLKKFTDWDIAKTVVGRGASIGAGTILLPDIKIGKFALIGAGSVVTKSIPDHGLAFGNPAKLIGYVCYCGKKRFKNNKNKTCPKCKQSFVK